MSNLTHNIYIYFFLISIFIQYNLQDVCHLLFRAQPATSYTKFMPVTKCIRMLASVSQAWDIEAIQK